MENPGEGGRVKFLISEEVANAASREGPDVGGIVSIDGWVDKAGSRRRSLQFPFFMGAR